MKRDFYTDLVAWKDSDIRKPLLVRGARQTGKTFVVKEFGKNDFSNFVELNFERNPEYTEIFSSRIPEEIVERISLYTGQKVIAGKTLIFLDEIQDCPEAIISLRYFYEEMPELHVVGAGSLLEFALRSENFRMPVGRVQYLYLYPMSFGEFLDAMGESVLRKHLREFVNLKKLPLTLHEKLTELTRKYFIIGGMPAVVKEYVANRDIKKCQRIQRSVLDTYVDDFAKYSKVIKHNTLRNVFHAVPKMVGQKFVYAQVDRNTKSREIKEALELLETAGVLTRVRQSSGAGLPLAGAVHESFFKVIFIDVGLFQNISGMYAETAKGKDLTAIYKGAIAEQFAGQELIAHSWRHTKAELFYWGRKAKNSTAEIDYLIEKDGKIIPVEIKSGSTGRMKSMHMFNEQFNIQKALKISQAPFADGNPIVSLPFYGIESFMIT